MVHSLFISSPSCTFLKVAQSHVSGLLFIWLHSTMMCNSLSSSLFHLGHLVFVYMFLGHSMSNQPKS